MTTIEIIKLGQRYLSLWPEKKELTMYFADYKVVQSARFICKYFPALALFTFMMQFYFSSGLYAGIGFDTLSTDNILSALGQALFYGVFIGSLPIQALVIVGVKADKFLPPSLASWYREGIEKMKSANNGQSIDPVVSKLATYKPRYIDLAQLLQLTFLAAKK
jgi:hypothetical protein